MKFPHRIYASRIVLRRPNSLYVWNVLSTHQGFWGFGDYLACAIDLPFRNPRDKIQVSQHREHLLTYWLRKNT